MEKPKCFPNLPATPQRHQLRATVAPLRMMVTHGSTLDVGPTSLRSALLRLKRKIPATAFGRRCYYRLKPSCVHDDTETNDTVTSLTTTKRSAWTLQRCQFDPNQTCALQKRSCDGKCLLFVLFKEKCLCFPLLGLGSRKTVQHRLQFTSMQSVDAEYKVLIY